MTWFTCLITRPKVHRIVLLQPFSWITRAKIYIGAIGTLFLFIEPLGVFNLGKEFFEDSGYVGYAVLLSLGIVITVAVEYLKQRVSEAVFVFYKFTIHLTTSGEEYRLEVPRSMRVSKFLELFVRRFKLDESLIAVDRYKLDLLVKRNGQFQALPDDSTIAEVGIVDGDECRIKGKILRHYSNITLSTVEDEKLRNTKEIEIDIGYTATHVTAV